MNTVPSRFFFVHVMKTAGGTFREHVLRNFDVGEWYPVGKYDGGSLESYWDIKRLLALPQRRRDRIRVYFGHFPFVAAQLLGLELVTMTLLRDPVERTISYLRMASERHPGKSLEKIYEDPFDFPCFIHNHQTKVFSLTAEDDPESFMDVIHVDADRLEIAKRNLRSVDLIGFTEHFDDFLREVQARYGWRISKVRNAHVSTQQDEVSPAFRDRIAEENEIDLLLYQYALQLRSEPGSRISQSSSSDRP